MADPSAVFPFHDPYESSYTDDVLNVFTPPNPTFADLSLIEESLIEESLIEESFMHPSTLPSSSVPQSNINIGDANDPFIDLSNINIGDANAPFNDLSNINIGDANDPFNDPIVWDTINRFHGESSQADPSQNHAETSNQERPENDNYVNMRRFTIWPVPPVPYLCSCCLVLREINHTNGYETTKLEIHGRLGMICHAILEIRHRTSMNQYHMFDFCKKSIEDVKNFLVQYCEERKQAGFFVLPDPLSIFYEALCVGLDLDDNLTTDDYVQPPVTNSGANEMDTVEVENESDKSRRISLAAQVLVIFPNTEQQGLAQRERTGKLSLEDLVEYFHLPIEEAAKRLKLCPTVVKKICRRGGLLRWPHRKIKSIKKQILALTARLESSDAEETANIQAQIKGLRDQMKAICAAGDR
ncbi:hypothetical protein JRO89_XS03G0294200 [Xanthoceras sorbifolium]|uniref:RWP-RK domain-containing protein n=1 Tax=Xanthoceras sorbifolium TaxID=99658 RepID=A0ABQ8IDV6_9ROSI|nr:hypothetical protein JRO89_XS03G0294200 [Xanthoceras sorbifolium]